MYLGIVVILEHHHAVVAVCATNGDANWCVHMATERKLIAPTATTRVSITTIRVFKKKCVKTKALGHTDTPGRIICCIDRPGPNYIRLGRTSICLLVR